MGRIREMSIGVLGALFSLALTLHNIEEALMLPSWSQTAGRWHHPVAPWEFRFAVIVLTLLAYACALLAKLGGKNSLGAYLLVGYALAMFVNVLFPHVLATIVMNRYAPGTATALLLILPTTALLLYFGHEKGYVQRRRFLWAGPSVVAGIMALIPGLFVIGITLQRVLKS